MKYELYRAACVGETKDVHIACLTDVMLEKPKNEIIRPGLGRLLNGSITFKTEDEIDGRISSHYEYFIVDENGERFDFQVSQIGLPIKVIDGFFVVSIF